MQTFDPLAPASHPSRTQNNEANLPAKHPTQNDEKFGALMDRALSRSPHESLRDHNDSSAIQKSERQNLSSTKDHSVKSAIKPKKNLRRDLDGNAPANLQQGTVNADEQNTLRPTNLNPAHGDGDSLEDVRETDAENGASTTGSEKADDASKSSTAQFLVLAGLTLGMPAPAPSPQGTIAGKGSAKESKGAATVSAKSENADKSSTLSEVLDSTGKIVPNALDSKNNQAKDSAAHAEDASAAQDSSIQDQQAQSTETDATSAQATAALGTTLPDSAHATAAKEKTPGDNISTSAADPHGTSAAKQYMTMKKAEKTTKAAGLTEQDLPGEPTVGGVELLTGEKLSARDLSASSNKVDSTVAIDAATATRISPSQDTAASNITAAAVAPVTNADSRLKVLERTHDILALHAMRLGETGMDSLHVVVKPGEGIQLSLELRQKEGSIEVQASLHKGDYEHLKQYWPELQQRLEARGVRVGDLTCSDNFSSTSHQQFQQSKQQTAQQDPLYAGAFAEFALAGSLSEAPATRAARATAYRGWETWA